MVARRIKETLTEFLQTESAAGVVMIFSALMAFIWANSPWHSVYAHMIHYPLTIGLNTFAMTLSVDDWVKDVLMVFFFLVVALELKKEMVEGALSKPDQVLLPLLAAIGGMAVPAFIFLFFNHHHPDNLSGWAIPCATDIAFALCVLMLLGKKIPPAIKVFLLAVAIFDDLGAIVIIAAFYTGDLSLWPLVWGALGVFMLFLLHRKRVSRLWPYYAVGLFLWSCFHHAGVHTTIAGVVVGMSIPLSNPKDPNHSPLSQHMHYLHPWVSFLVLPIFAFVSAGVSLAGVSVADFFSRLPMGVALGLFLGKPIGVFGTTYLLVKAKWVAPIHGVTWRQIWGVSLLAGIGFTMSLFISLLAFHDQHLQDMAKLGVLSGSLLSALVGYAWMRSSTRET